MVNTKSNDKKYNMYYGASPILFELAEQLRSKMTLAEEVLWNAIKLNDWHIKFRRQHPLSLYIADFYCHKVKLVIELDGGYHQNRDVKIYDAAREQHITEFGISVLRFTNEEVLNNISDVINKIGKTIKKIQSAQSEVVTTNNSPLGVGGKLFVIKIGGNVIDNETALTAFLAKFSAIQSPKILIHGGGKIATKIGEKLGIASQYINGRRITDAETIDLVTMVYGGLVNKKIVAALQLFNCNAIGITGADGNAISSTKRPITQDGIDFGFVGDINSSSVNIQYLKLLLQNNLVPVMAPLTHDGAGQILNTNADTIASSIAVALSKIYEVRLIYCFEKNGVLENVEDETSVIPLITKEIYQQLKNANKLFDGILPKIDNAFDAINTGVAEVLIGHADDLLQNVTHQTIGTLIK